MSGELLGNGAHPCRRHGRGAGEEALEDHVEHPSAGLQRRIELDAADERTEELVDHAAAETLRFECDERRDVGLAQQVRGRGPAQAVPQAEQTKLVRSRPDPGDARPQQRSRPADRIADQVHLRSVPHQGARLEAPQLQRRHVELGLELRICGQHHLEPAVELIAVDQVGADAATHAV